MMEYTLILNDQQLGIINAALMEMPFKHAAPLVDHINQQLSTANHKHQDDKDKNKA